LDAGQYKLPLHAFQRRRWCESGECSSELRGKWTKKALSKGGLHLDFLESYWGAPAIIL
jgi:hypothetical protein